MDLLSAPLRFGLYALNFTLTSLILYSWKQHFFEDDHTTLPILTFFFSFLSTGIQIILLYVFESGLTLSWQWALFDLFVMPALDACYAWCFFCLPLLIWGKKIRSGKEYFLH